MHLIDMSPVAFLPIVGLQRIERQRIDFPCWSTDAISVVFDDEQHRQFLFFGETDRFEEIPLASRGVANGCDNEIFLLVEFDAPRDATGGKKFRASWRRHAPDMQFRVTVVRRHLTSAAAGAAL